MQWATHPLLPVLSSKALLYAQWEDINDRQPNNLILEIVGSLHGNVAWSCERLNGVPDSSWPGLQYPLLVK